jgi:hypothetical protein
MSAACAQVGSGLVIPAAGNKPPRSANVEARIPACIWCGLLLLDLVCLHSIEVE